MSKSTKPKMRHSVRYLCKMYEEGNKKPLEDLVRAWKKIKELPPKDKRSFFTLGGYHGEPFVDRPAVDALPDADWYLYWGGYCQHGNVLFPTWHRAYVYKLEKALQSFEPDVMMPYWDETSKETQKHGIPWVLTDNKFTLDGKKIDNPLKSFVLPAAVADNARMEQFEGGSVDLYAKPKGYETVRYPLSGLVGTPEARKKTKKHNARPEFNTAKKRTDLLNQNVEAWLKGGSVTSTNPNPTKKGILSKYQDCLDAPNYTVFSNTTSAGAWNSSQEGKSIVPLESPHNSMHLAVGGFDVPGQGQSGQIAGANGDMGENNTAGLDPIFFFHHCYVDRMFWLWQTRHHCNDKAQTPCTEKLEIIGGYQGTFTHDSQGPTPNLSPNAQLDLKTPLEPFLKDDMGTFYVSEDCINIHDMGYDYPPITKEEQKPKSAEKSEKAAGKKLIVKGINRSLFQGSFVIEAYAKVNGETHYLGHEAILSRGNVARCANCLTHIEVAAGFPLNGLSESKKQPDYHISITHRGSEFHPVQSLTFNTQKKGSLRGQNLPDGLSHTIEVKD